MNYSITLILSWLTECYTTNYAQGSITNCVTGTFFVVLSSRIQQIGSPNIQGYTGGSKGGGAMLPSPRGQAPRMH